MTGSLVRCAWSVGKFAMSRAPPESNRLALGALGVLASLAYELGAWLQPLEFQAAKVEPSSTASPTLADKTVVVIPALVRSHDEQVALETCVRAIVTDRADVPIIVVDDGSPTPLELSHCTVVRHERNCGPAAAHNTGVALALEDAAAVIVFTDIDCRPEPGWLAAHEALQTSSPGVWAGYTVANATDLVSRFHDTVGTLMPRVFDDGVNALYGPTCNLSISAPVASSVRFDARFPTSAYEDCDFCVRCAVHGFKVRASRDPTVVHVFATTLSGLLRTYHKYGRAEPLMLRAHPEYTEMLRRTAPARGAK